MMRNAIGMAPVGRCIHSSKMTARYGRSGSRGRANDVASLSHGLAAECPTKRLSGYVITVAAYIVLLLWMIDKRNPNEAFPIQKRGENPCGKPGETAGQRGAGQRSEEARTT
jgi:hypothetical protein